MAENATSTNTSESAQTAPTNEGQEQSGKTFTQSEVDEIVSKRLQREKSQADENYKLNIARERAEWERQSKLTEEQRANEAQAKRAQELDEKERNITLRENRATAIEELAKKNIDTSLVDFVVDLNVEQMESNIKALEKSFNTAVQKAVDERLQRAGSTPQDFGSGARTTTTKNKRALRGTVSF